MYYGSYSGAPANSNNIQPTDWNPPLKSPYATLPIIKEGSRDEPANLFAWKLFWVLGGYKEDDENGEEDAGTKSNVDEATDWFRSTRYPPHWAEAQLKEFGPNLTKRVKWFQTEMGLPVTGIIDGGTWKKLGELSGLELKAAHKVGGLNLPFGLTPYAALGGLAVIGVVSVLIWNQTQK